MNFDGVVGEMCGTSGALYFAAEGWDPLNLPGEGSSAPLDIRGLSAHFFQNPKWVCPYAALLDYHQPMSRKRASLTDESLRFIVVGIAVALFLMILIIYKFNL